MEGHSSDEAPTEPPRSLTEREREVLDFLLSVDAPGVQELRLQTVSALASRWTCGCASIDLTVDRTSAPVAAIRGQPAIEARTKEGDDPERLFVLLLWVDDGWLSALEIMDFLERHEDSPDELPPPSAFNPPRVRVDAG